MTHNGTSLGESLTGGLAIAFALVTPFLRSRRRRWGARDAERHETHPGDELVPEPKWTADHAISIDAPPEQVWPWLAQLGQGRGGFYSYEKLENLAGCQIENASRVLEAHQQIGVGDPVKLHVEVPPMVAAIVDPPTTLVLHGDPSGGSSGPSISTSTLR